jgi:WD40 repeat protein
MLDLSSQRVVRTVKMPAAIAHGTFFSRSGSGMLTVASERVDVWNAVTGEHRSQIHGHSDRLSSAQFDPTGSLVFTTSWDRTARTWDAASGKLIETFDPNVGVLTCGALSPDGKRAVLCGGSGPTLWDVAPYTGPLETFMTTVACQVPYHYAQGHLANGPERDTCNGI